MKDGEVEQVLVERERMVVGVEMGEVVVGVAAVVMVLLARVAPTETTTMRLVDEG